MKSAAFLVAGIALTVGAHASVDFFFTSSTGPYGLREPSLALLPAGLNGTDYLDGYELTKDGGGAYLVPPLGPLPDATVNCELGEWAYIWARFNNEPLGKVNGLRMDINGALEGPGNIAWYLCNNVNDPNIMEKRWDGEMQLFYKNPASLVAVTAYGIRHRMTDQGWNLYVGGDYRTVLLGAVKCGTCPGELTFNIENMLLCFQDPPICPPLTALNKVVGVPEPASLLLWAAAGLAWRRR